MHGCIITTAIPRLAFLCNSFLFFIFFFKFANSFDEDRLLKQLSLFVITRWIYDLRVNEFKRLTNSRILILPRYGINVCASRISLKSALFSNYNNIHCFAANQCNYLKYSRGTFRINFITKCVPFPLPPSPFSRHAFTCNALLWDLVIWFSAPEWAMQIFAGPARICPVYKFNWLHCVVANS